MVIRFACRNAKRYKGKRMPRCNGGDGNPCGSCQETWKRVQYGKLRILEKLAR